jgi:CRP-like cAMP-binding protein
MVTHDGEMAKRVHRTIIITDGELIEAALTVPFPNLTETQLVKATSQLRYDRWQPGESIIRQGEPFSRFYVITKGMLEARVDLSVNAKTPQEIFQPGSVLGEPGVLRGGTAPWTVRCSSDCVSETVSMDITTASGILGESIETLKMLAELDHTRSVTCNNNTRKEA